MGSGNNEILDTFLYETNTLLEQLENIVMTCEQADTFSQDDVNEIFRIMHTIKGSCAMMEYNSMATVGHRIEDLFFIIRENTISVVPESERPLLFDILFQSIDFFRAEIRKIETGEALSDDIDTIVGKINSLIAKIRQDETGEAAPKEAPAAAPETAAPALASAGDEVSVFQPDAAFPYLLHVRFDEGSGMESLRAFMLVSSVRDFCAEGTFSFHPSDVETNTAASEFIVENGFLLQFRSAADRDKGISAAMAAGSVKEYQPHDLPTPAAESAVQTQSVSAAPAAQQSKAAPAAAQQPHAARESLISVNLSKLDQLMAVVSEIVITESMVTASPDLKGLKLDLFNKSARELRKLTDELQDVSMSLRMVPVSATFQKMSRIVRDMSKKLSKQTRLVLEGEDTEVDKTIVDSISDPIMHIVRNSMDHGIESDVQARTAAGKDSVGTICLSARHTGSEVIIEVRDDGAGVDCDAVLQKAIRVGLASPDVNYSEKEILNFLLLPGFSTNAEVTEYSGRGVGMDVVKKNVEEVGGVVTITSERGKGMTTTLKIPLTMAIMDGMEVSVGSSIFTIPINNIRQNFKVTAGEVIYDAAQGEMIKCMDSFYPIIRIKDFYHLDEGLDNIEDGVLMWVEAGEQSYCLFVDELIGEQQIVVKPLPAYVNTFNIKNYGISGCTIMGDGSISIILDIANFFSATQIAS